MDRHQDLCLVGFSHRTANVAVRESFSLQEGEMREYLAAHREQSELDEAMILSTCNRTELLVVGGEEQDLPAFAKEGLLKGMPEEHVYVFRGIDAILHLFRVSSGLDSLVLGETEILGQVRRAATVAEECGTLGTYLRPLVEHALATGKRVRAETELGQGTLSVARVGVDVAKQAFGSLSNNRALVIGAGETGLLVAKHLRDEKIAGIDFANRTLSRAEAATEEFGGQALTLDQIPTVIGNADIIVVCIDGGVTALQVEHFKNVRKDEPQLVIDLSVPRAVDPKIASLPGALLYDMDDLGPVVEANRKARGEASGASSEILVGQVHKFLSLQTYASFSPAIAELNSRFDAVRDEALEQTTEGSPTEREVALSRELSRRLLSLALEQLKLSARYTTSEESLERDYQRFMNSL